MCRGPGRLLPASSVIFDLTTSYLLIVGIDGWLLSTLHLVGGLVIVVSCGLKCDDVGWRGGGMCNRELVSKSFRFTSLQRKSAYPRGGTETPGLQNLQLYTDPGR